MRKLTSLFALLAALTIMTGLTLVGPPSAHAQATISTGGIVGTILDPNGASVSVAKITVTAKGTGQKYTPTVGASGDYSVSNLIPGEYVVRVEAAGFKTVERTFIVQVGQVVAGTITLEIGSSTTVVSVEASAVSVNTDQATVSGVLTAAQIDNLPVNGRNFLDLAQLEPGVQIQEGSTFDPTKNGFSSISFEGRFGRTARIEIDGVDISDETVGTTTQNIPASAIQEFQLSQSSLDLSTELTSSGAVNVTTRSGTNDLHGQAYGLFRGNQTSAALPHVAPSPAPPFQREQFGGRAGGALIKDKLFWFADAERTKQELIAAEPFTAQFASLPTTLGEPFRDLLTDERVDWNLGGSKRLFYRFNFEQNSQIRAFGSASSLQGFKNIDHAQTHVVGYDFSNGSFTHSIRFEYLKFRNLIADGTASIGGIDNPIPGLGINIGAPVAGSCVISGGGNFCGGPNLLAPQQTIQSNKAVKYDGSKIIGAHIIRYGATFNHIQGGGLAAFFTFPQVGTTSPCLIVPPAGQPCPKADMPSDPTLFPIQFAFLGNGIGFSTAKKAFGFPGGGLGPDNRFEFYVGDAWKIRHNVSVTAGLHYNLDTGRVDSDLGPLPILNQWAPGLGDRVYTPKNNFAPNLGVAWDLTGNGKTVIRAGGALLFENSIWNNVLFDSPGRIPMGVFSNTPLVCAGGGPSPFTWPVTIAAGTSVAGGAGTAVANNQVSPNFCGATIASAGSQVIALSNAFKAAAASNVGPAPNSNFIGTSLANCGTAGNTCSAANGSGFDIFDPRYKTPRSWQMNVGIQRELRKGMVVSADFIRNIGEHYLIVIDQNHSGAARSFNLANAIAARDAAQTAAGCPTGAGQSACIITALGVSGAQAAYSGAGLDSNIPFGGGPCSFCAFPGITPVNGNSGKLGVLDTLEPLGRSVYNGLQVKLVQNVTEPFHGVKAANFQVSYSLSKFVSQVQDQDFVTLAANNDRPLQFTGPNALDRRHQISFGGFFDLPWYTRLSLIGHFYSPLPQNILLPFSTSGGEIFATDYLGSGLGSAGAAEPVPGTQIGQFGGGGTSLSGLQNIISNYNSKFAGTFTPAGQQLVNNGVLTAADLTALGWVLPTLQSNMAGASNFTWLKSFDFGAAWPIPLLKDGRLKVTPSVGIFNVFNFRNAFLPGNLPSSTVGNGNASSIGGASVRDAAFQATFQSGTYALGAPRQFEFGLKIDF
jgi:Carboxypeptidase regulatory-like domain